MEHHLVDSAPIKVLKSGWYGFCFGNSRRGYKSCRCTASLIFSGEDHQVCYSVPFELANAPILSLNYGRLLYCRPETKVEMKYKEICPHHENRRTDLQWCLLPRHLSTVDGLVGGELSDRQKCLVCAHCGDKTFAQIESAEKHYRDAHKTFPADSVWNQPLDVLYDDEEVAVINKPQGVPVQGGEGKCLQKSALIVPLAKKVVGKAFIKKPIIVHRLDAATGGLLVLAKSKDSEKHLKTSFSKHQCKKRYRAVVFGKVKNTSNKIVEPISGKPAETYYDVVRHTRCVHPRANGWITTLDLRPISGRKHQIRKHLKHIGHPIWGDQRYAHYVKNHRSMDDQDDLSDDEKVDYLHRTSVKDNAHARLCLWAMEISFPHPLTANPVHVSLSEEPKWIAELLEYQEALYYGSCHAQEDGRTSG